MALDPLPLLASATLLFAALGAVGLRRRSLPILVISALVLVVTAAFAATAAALA